MSMKLCAVCGSENLSSKVVDQVFTYEGLSATVPNYKIWACQACGEEFTDPESDKQSELIVRDLHRRAENLLTSTEIRRIREALGFSQDEFGRLLGGGLKAFARYESGSVLQSRPMDNLLRVIWEAPDVINTLYRNQQRVAYSVSYQHGSIPYKFNTPSFAVRDAQPTYSVETLQADDFLEAV